MKGFIYSVWLNCLACTAAAQESQSAPAQELPPLQNPEQVSIHREAPRTQLYSYNKKSLHWPAIPVPRPTCKNSAANGK
ncbi:MAG: hypothetical protein ACLR8Y_13995 [Alistipes indistinctus]